LSYLLPLAQNEKHFEPQEEIYLALGVDGGLPKAF
jgi:hypothetical protein